jgi:predicted phosphoadenosine phosphosulfate sulfurtransferase
MKIYSDENVYDKALERFRFLFDEFPVCVCCSGGKDSAVVLELALKVAKEKNMLPLKVMFLDQEAEWTATIDYIKKLKQNPDIDLYWYQIPFKELNGTSFDETWLTCWDEKEKDKWIRPQEKDSIKINNYGTDRFVDLFHKIFAKDFPKHCAISGVRCEESPGRYVGLTEMITYKWITWGKKLNNTPQYTFYPIYDWSYTDVWKAIHENDWDYNEVYDYQYRYGVKINDMRVSNLHHETAVRSLFYLQEVDSALYGKLTKRLKGIDTAGKMGFDDYFVKKLPYMFKTWGEYRDFLMGKLVTDKKWYKSLRHYADEWDELFKDDQKNKDRSAKVIVQSIVVNDLEGTKLKNYRVSFVGLYKKDLKRRAEKLKKKL